MSNNKSINENRDTQVCSPVVVMAFNRPDALRQTLCCLSANTLSNQTDLFVFVDGPREDKICEKEKVKESVEVARQAKGFKTLTIHTSEKNKGLAKSIIGAVTDIINRYGKVILVEDDLFLSPSFLLYMNQMLAHFEKDKRVFQVSGYSALITKKTESDVYLNVRGQCWTWGTWKDRWDTIDWEINDFEEFKKDKGERREWSKYGSDLFSMLESWKNGRLDSWWIRFSYNMFKQKRFAVCPIRSLVRNDGFGADSTHCDSYNIYKISFDSEKNKFFKVPDNIRWYPKLNRHATRYWSIRYRGYKKIMTTCYRLNGKRFD